MTLQDDFLINLQDAAKQVRPVAGLDGVAMARRAVRRERARRATLTGVGGLAVTAAIAGGSLAAGPVQDAGPASGDVPAGWTPVAVGGVNLAVPPGLESRVDGVWERGDDFVQVQLGGDVPLVPEGSGLTPADVDVPGSASAEYVTQTLTDATSVQEFFGNLQVRLESGHVVQVSLVWTDKTEGGEVFADLMRSVAVVDGTDLPEALEATGDPQQLEGYVAGTPDGWADSEFAGLTYALPPTWVADEASATAFPSGSTLRFSSADGKARLAISQSTDSASWPVEADSSNHYPTYTFPLEGADVVRVDPRSQDGTLREQVRLRREGGRGYLIEIEAPDTAEGQALTLQLVGALGFGAGSESVPGPDDLPPLPTSDAPEGWTEARWEGLRLAVPPEWTESSTPDGGSWASDPNATLPEEKVSVSGGRFESSAAVIPPYGYRHDVPGADRAVIQLGEEHAEDGSSRFLGIVELYRGDEHVVLEYSGPVGSDSRTRFGMLVQSLELDGS